MKCTCARCGKKTFVNKSGARKIVVKIWLDKRIYFCRACLSELFNVFYKQLVEEYDEVQ